MSEIITEGLTKRFNSFTAVDRLSFEVGEGEIFGILGPNGAGKTTTIRMLACLLTPTEGTAFVGGFDVVDDSLKVREMVGILTENPSLYDRLTAMENMEFFAEAYGVSDRQARSKKIRELLEFFDLWPRRDDKVGTYSKGMKQKLAIARALVHDPDILLLDEPTSGLDPRSSKDIRDLMEELSRREGQTILLCTHRLEDAERLCSRVMLINEGGMVTMGTTDELRSQIAGTPILRVRLGEVSEAVVGAVRSMEGVEEVAVDGTTLSVSVYDVDRVTPYLVRSVVMAGGMVQSVEVLEPSLEEIYLKLVVDEDEAE
ncbi:ABC transporter ATP-binding protein [Candidatus Bathyarchaeota archaeon]|nr:ABC transporter ATP-binding protein [Candidatus Bathyarchaeota archaeon]